MNAPLRGAPLTPLPTRGGRSVPKRVLDNADDIIDVRGFWAWRGHADARGILRRDVHGRAVKAGRLAHSETVRFA